MDTTNSLLYSEGPPTPPTTTTREQAPQPPPNTTSLTPPKKCHCGKCNRNCDCMAINNFECCYCECFPAAARISP